mmetsp:Transcript_13008/g.15267  ORF Transcript_13008/g.15267 Transcript_13008/m.15267 type:complete len:102 (+) Transcript_13008:1171-1476(+)
MYHAAKILITQRIRLTRSHEDPLQSLIPFDKLFALIMIDGRLRAMAVMVYTQKGPLQSLPVTLQTDSQTLEMIRQGSTHILPQLEQSFPIPSHIRAAILNC